MGGDVRGLCQEQGGHSRQLVKRISIPLPQKGEAAAFYRLELRKSLSLPMLNCAAMVHCEGKTVTWARIAMAPVGVGPVRAAAARGVSEGPRTDGSGHGPHG